jgi:actin-related protein
VREGVIEDWDAMERIVEHSLRAQMRLPSLEEHPLLISEPSWQNKENRERWTELAFEGWGAPAFYSVDKNVLTSFSVGKGTSLILDVGEDSTSCVPIYDGFVIRKGGRLLTFAVRQATTSDEWMNLTLPFSRDLQASKNRLSVAPSSLPTFLAPSGQAHRPSPSVRTI